MGRKRTKKKRNPNLVFTKFVRHPGTKPKPYLIPSLEEGNKLLSSKLTRLFVTPQDIDSLFRSMALIVRGIALAIVARARVSAPRDTGNLARSINARQIDDFSWIIGTNTQYARFVEFGTKPHTIRPKTKKVLVFKTKGKR